MKIPDLSSLTVYGIPWMAVGATFVWMLNKKHVISEFLLIFTALWAALGYLLTTNLQAIEVLWPTMPDILPQLLTVILVIGSVLGFQPGETANKIKTKIANTRFAAKLRRVSW